jgi:hypothetical protein
VIGKRFKFGKGIAPGNQSFLAAPNQNAHSGGECDTEQLASIDSHLGLCLGKQDPVDAQLYVQTHNLVSTAVTFGYTASGTSIAIAMVV